MTFTEQFETLSIDAKNQFANDERNKRVKEDINKYVAIPIAVPVMGKLSATPVDWKLGWAVGVPGEQADHTGKAARAALTLGFPDEEAANDFCYLMNKAREERDLSQVAKLIA